MKKLSFILFIILLACCTSKQKNTTHTSGYPYLDSIASYMAGFAKDTAIIYDVRLNDNESYRNIVGKFIDSATVYALSIIPEDTMITFHRFEKDVWLPVGSYRAISDVIFRIEFTDMDNDNKNEIIVCTPPNMNANTWQDVFRYSSENDSIELAGSFSSDFEIKKENKTVEVSYEGSWYMPLVKTLYQWHNNKLVCIKETSLTLEDEDNENAVRTFRYYENPYLDKDSLVLKIEAPYDERKHKDMWDSFFNNNGN